jgi:hypothetical protein
MNISMFVPLLLLDIAIASAQSSGTFTATGNMTTARFMHTATLVQLLVNTARGVRVVDFGLPPVPQVDSEGHVTNFKLIIINDCPSAVDQWFQVFHSYNPKWSVDPYESWIDNMETVAAFGASLLVVNGLHAGELITFDQPMDGGLAVFSAVHTGQVVVPAVLAVRSFDAPVTLSRLNRTTLGAVGQTTMFFERVAVLDTPGALSHQLLGDGDRAVITTSFVDRTESIQIDSLGIPQRLGNQRLEGARACASRRYTRKSIVGSIFRDWFTCGRFPASSTSQSR